MSVCASELLLGFEHMLLTQRQLFTRPSRVSGYAHRFCRPIEKKMEILKNKDRKVSEETEMQ